ncbi:4639_t:CDS:1, partial [Ambispora gerdemannii]
ELAETCWHSSKEKLNSDESEGGVHPTGKVHPEFYIIYTGYYVTHT